MRDEEFSDLTVREAIKITSILPPTGPSKQGIRLNHFTKTGLMVVSWDLEGCWRCAIATPPRQGHSELLIPLQLKAVQLSR